MGSKNFEDYKKLKKLLDKLKRKKEGKYIYKTEYRYLE